MEYVLSMYIIILSLWLTYVNSPVHCSISVYTEHIIKGLNLRFHGCIVVLECCFSPNCFSGKTFPTLEAVGRFFFFLFFNNSVGKFPGNHKQECKSVASYPVANFYLTQPFLDLVSGHSSNWHSAHARVGAVQPLNLEANLGLLHMLQGSK